MGGLEGRRVAITGATGFIGSNLTKRLVKEGMNVSVLVRSNDIKENPILREVQDKLNIFVCNLLDLPNLRKVMNSISPDIVYHLGGVVDLTRSFEIAHKCVQVNIQGTVNILNSLVDLNCSCFIHTGTCEVYKKGLVPFREENEIEPISPYSISKVASEYYCKFAQKEFGIPIVLLRLSTVYGINQKLQHLIPYVIRSCAKGNDIHLTLGDQTRDFTYVDDVVDGILKASLSKRAVGEIINLGNDREFTIREVVEEIVALMGSPIKPQFGVLAKRSEEHERWFCDITKVKQILHWTPKTDMRTGLIKTVSWYREKIASGELS